MKVVQDQDGGLLKLAQFVKQGGEHQVQWLERRQAMGAQQLQCLFASFRAEALAGGDDIAPETDRIVVALVEGDAGDKEKARLRTTFSEPLPDERCLAIAGRSRNERQFALQSLIQHL